MNYLRSNYLLFSLFVFIKDTGNFLLEGNLVVKEREEIQEGSYPPSFFGIGVRAAGDIQNLPNFSLQLFGFILYLLLCILNVYIIVLYIFYLGILQCSPTKIALKFVENICLISVLTMFVFVSEKKMVCILYQYYYQVALNPY